MNRNQKPTFTDYEPGPDFDRARILIATPFQYKDIDLSTALTNEVFQIAGDFLYLDAASTGYITLELNNQWDAPAAPFLAQPGFAINAIFKQVKITAPAQAGKFVRIMYSTGERIAPTNSSTINGTVTVNNAADDYTNSFASTTVLAANTAQQICAPASNTNGLVIKRASGITFVGSNLAQLSLIAKSSAPTSVNDGDVIATLDSFIPNGGSFMGAFKLENPIKIAAGKGLYFISTFSEAAGDVQRACLYSIL